MFCSTILALCLSYNMNGANYSSHFSIYWISFRNGSIHSDKTFQVACFILFWYFSQMAIFKLFSVLAAPFWIWKDIRLLESAVAIMGSLVVFIFIIFNHFLLIYCHFCFEIIFLSHDRATVLL